ncbi:MAG: hypothetical protein BWX55_00799 [Deltaproteobacteria bacterium ADurb.Bin022]|mgnify:FL=1|jgi:hypothetical protein|nr:MAG: hypothetical protein BWX55_00799 [Deltaproteobacteria bacterium ADurb.Bin022]
MDLPPSAARDNLMSLDFYPEGHCAETKCPENLSANYPAQLSFGDSSLWDPIRDPQVHYPATFRR